MLVQSLTSLDVHNIRSHIWLESLLLTTCKIAPIARSEAAGVTEAEPQRRHRKQHNQKQHLRGSTCLSFSLGGCTLDPGTPGVRV